MRLKVIKGCVAAVALVISMVVGMSDVQAAATINWQGEGIPNPDALAWLGNSDISDRPLGNSPNEALFPNGTYSSWYVELVAYSGAMDWNNLYTSYVTGDWSLGVNETSVGNSLFNGDLASAPFGFGESSALDATTYQNQHLYVRFFDADSIDNATQAGFVFDEGWAVPANDSALSFDIFTSTGNKQGTLAHNAGVGAMATGAEGGWYTVAVPEPGTMALFGLGVVVLAYRRRRS